jgi:hypothetical protein
MQPNDVEQIALAATAHLKAFFIDADAATVLDIAKARVAASVLSSYTRLIASASARDALMFNIARELADDKEQLADYIAIAVPSAPFRRALLEPVLR